jgi:uncharacterized membrane protein
VGAFLKGAPSDAWAYVVMVTYGALFAFGLVSYALSPQLFRRFLHRTVRAGLVAPVILLVHALCVLAMYLGRFIRLNSWDVLVAPGTVVGSVMHIPRPTTVVVLGVMFVVVGVGVFVTLAITDKVLARARHLL